jgi:hypothetical protein
MDAMARHYERKRHELPGATIVVLRPLLRYSRSRDAYVLRAVGNRAGPVLKRRPPGGRFARPEAGPAAAEPPATKSFPRTLTPRRRP